MVGPDAPPTHGRYRGVACLNAVGFGMSPSAQISFSRGKKRYMFDFRFELKWEAPDLDCGPAKGVLVYPDVGQDCDGEYDVECQARMEKLSAVASVCWYIREERPLLLFLLCGAGPSVAVAGPSASMRAHGRDVFSHARRGKCSCRAIEAGCG